MPKTHLPAFFLHTSWPILIKCCMIKEHIDIGFFIEKKIFLRGNPMGQKDGRNLFRKLVQKYFRKELLKSDFKSGLALPWRHEDHTGLDHLDDCLNMLLELDSTGVSGDRPRQQSYGACAPSAAVLEAEAAVGGRPPRLEAGRAQAAEEAPARQGQRHLWRVGGQGRLKSKAVRDIFWKIGAIAIELQRGFVMFCFGSPPCPAWAVASCSSGPQAGGTLKKPLCMMGWETLYTFYALNYANQSNDPLRGKNN